MANLQKTILPREILTGENILNKAFPASVARFFMLQAH
jgi:cysteinyl-tRNA synthetase